MGVWDDEAAAAGRTAFPGTMAGAAGDALEQVDQLVVTDARNDAFIGRRYPLHGSVAIGRVQTADDQQQVVLSFDSAVSSRHAAIEQRVDGWYCLDRGSRNGTFVNGSQIAAPTRLRAGDEIRVGGTRFTFVGKASAEARDLPFPLIASELIVRAQPNPLGRAKAVCDAVERTLKFIVACELGALIAEDRAAEITSALKPARELATKISQGRALTMGDWYATTLRLAARVRGLPESPIRAAVLTFISRDDSPSRLAGQIAALIKWRNETVAHGAMIAEGAIAFGLEERQKTLRDLLSATSPLSAMSLVSRVNLIDADFDRRAYIFEVHAHDGAQEVFPVTQCETSDKLLPGWCYLVARSGVSRAISLSPIVGVGIAPTGRKLEVGDASGIQFATGAVELHGVTTGMAFKVPYAPPAPLANATRTLRDPTISE